MKEIICIVCPKGCALRVAEGASGGGFSATGALCKRGEAFAAQEMTAPVRTLTLNVATVFEDAPVVSVRTDGVVPKDALGAIIAELKKMTITDRLPIGTPILKNALGSGVDVILTTDIVENGV